MKLLKVVILSLATVVLASRFCDKPEAHSATMLSDRICFRCVRCGLVQTYNKWPGQPNCPNDGAMMVKTDCQ